MRPRLPMLGPGIAAVLGIVVADNLEIAHPVWLGGLALCLLATLFRPRTSLALPAVAFTFAALHTIRFVENSAREIESHLAAGDRVAKVTGVVISAPEPLSYFAFRQTGTFRLKVSTLEVDGASWPGEPVLLTTWAGPLPAYGDRVLIQGSLSGLKGARNPGQFDYAQYLRRAGIFARLESEYPADCVIQGHDAGNPLRAFALRSAEWMRAQLSRDLEDSPEIATLIASMVLGMRGETPEEMKEMFRVTGTLHLFAVSGLNTAMLAIIASHLLKLFGLGRRVIAMLTVPILFFYAVVTGLSPSCIRAAIMGALVLVGVLVERPALVINTLFAAAVLILGWDTNQLFAPGFQFSFILVVVIVSFADRISKWLEPLAAPDPFVPKALWNWRQHCLSFTSRVIAAAVGLTVAAWVGSLTLTAGYFHLFSPSGLLANLVAVPLAFLVLALGVGTVCVAPIWKSLAIVFNNANWACAKLLLASVHWFAMLPGSHLYVELPRTKPSACELTVLDLGEGAGIHLRSGGKDWLIDGGPAWRNDSTTLPYLRSRGINRLDGLILTHGDANHIGAALALLDDVKPRQIFDSQPKDRSSTRKKFHAELARRKRGQAFLARGDELSAGDARIRVLYPPAGWQHANADDKALILLVETQGQRILLMSDSGLVAERWLMQGEPDLRADVLIKGHHAKDFSGTADFLALIRPKVAIVGDPGRSKAAATLGEWTTAAAQQDITVFRQDQSGAVTITIDDGTLTVRAFLSDQTFRSRAR